MLSRSLWPVSALLVAPALAEPPPVLLSRPLVDARGIEVGEVVRIGPDSSGAGARPYRVAGVYEPLPDPLRLTAKRHEARFHLSDLIELTAASGDPAAAESVTRISIALEEPATAPALAREIEARLPGHRAVPTAVLDSSSELFVVLQRFQTAIAAVTVLGSVAFLLALMVIRAEERREMAGILRLLGCTRRRVLRLILVESLLVSIAGALFGLALSLVAQGLFNRFFQQHYDTSLVFVRITPSIALTAVAVAAPLGITAGIGASWTLLRRDMMSLLKR